MTHHPRQAEQTSRSQLGRLWDSEGPNQHRRCAMVRDFIGKISQIVIHNGAPLQAPTSNTSVVIPDGPARDVDKVRRQIEVRQTGFKSWFSLLPEFRYLLTIQSTIGGPLCAWDPLKRTEHFDYVEMTRSSCVSRPSRRHSLCRIGKVNFAICKRPKSLEKRNSFE